MSTDQKSLNALTSQIAGLPAFDRDNLAVALCTYFQNLPDCPEDQEPSETGWTPWAEEQANALLERIAGCAYKAQQEAVAAAFDEPVVDRSMKAGCIGENTFTVVDAGTCPQCWVHQKDTCDVCAGEADEEGFYDITVEVPWDTQKNIFERMCAVKAAAIRERAEKG